MAIGIWGDGNKSEPDEGETRKVQNGSGIVGIADTQNKTYMGNRHEHEHEHKRGQRTAHRRKRSNTEIKYQESKRDEQAL